jgi:hypothetical protein
MSSSSTSLNALSLIRRLWSVLNSNKLTSWPTPFVCMDLLSSAHAAVGSWLILKGHFYFRYVPAYTLIRVPVEFAFVFCSSTSSLII